MFNKQLHLNFSRIATYQQFDNIAVDVKVGARKTSFDQGTQSLL